MTALRVARQGTTLLRDGVFDPQVAADRDLMLAIRADGLTGTPRDRWLAGLEQALAALEDAATDPSPFLRLNRDVVTTFLTGAYGV